MDRSAGLCYSPEHIYFTFFFQKQAVVYGKTILSFKIK